MEKANILVVDDDKEIAELVGIHLREEGYEVYKAYSGKEALKIFKQERIDLVILDVMMPVMDGNQVCSKIRDTSAVPIIMLSAKDAEMDMVSSLYQGADDYVTKPFSPKEIAYRVKAQLRRAEYKHTSSENYSVKIGDLMIDTEGCKVMKGNSTIELTAREFEILKYLAENKGRVISRERLYEAIWGEDSFGCDNTIMVHIRHLREKLEDNPTTPQYIITMKGLGYKLVNPYEK